ncbi:MAG TPA: DUF2244 domain-containing protein [Afifellaceae bacterium]|nr:DUF2244 domain-containing protein [Afifellaceae bacterium]
MTSRNGDDAIFSATLTPHRSLGRKAFLLLMLLIGGVWFLTGLYFWSLGAWPVLGFVGLDFLAIWIAFKLNYRAGRAYEEVEVTRDLLTIRRISPAGRVREFRFNPRWVRLDVETMEDFGTLRLAVRTRDERVPVGAFLNPADRQSFARALGAALAEARR